MKYYIKKYRWAILSALLLPGYLTLSNQRSSHNDPADKVLYPKNHLVITIDNFPEMQEDIRSLRKLAYDRQFDYAKATSQLEAPHRRTGAYDCVRNYLRSGVTTQLSSPLRPEDFGGQAEVEFSMRSIRSDRFVLSTIFGDKPIANIENGDLKIYEDPILSEIWKKTHTLSKLRINLNGEVSVIDKQDQQSDDYEVPYIITSPDIFLCRIVSIIKEMIVNDQAMQKVFSRDAHIKLNRAFIPKIYKNFADLCQGSLNEFKGYIESLKYEVLTYIDDLINCTYLLKQSLNNIKVMVNDFFEKALNPKMALNDLRDAAKNINISINNLGEIASMENIIIGYLDHNAKDIEAHMCNIEGYINNLEYISFDSMYHGILYMRSLVNEIDKICKSQSILIRELAHIAANLFSYQNLPIAASQFLQDFGSLYRIKDIDKKDPNVMPKLIKVLAWRTMISYTANKNIVHKNTVNKKQKIRSRPIVWVYHNI